MVFFLNIFIDLEEFTIKFYDFNLNDLNCFLIGFWVLQTLTLPDFYNLHSGYTQRWCHWNDKNKHKRRVCVMVMSPWKKQIAAANNLCVVVFICGLLESNERKHANKIN